MTYLVNAEKLIAGVWAVEAADALTSPGPTPGGHHATESFSLGLLEANATLIQSDLTTA